MISTYRFIGTIFLDEPDRKKSLRACILLFIREIERSINFTFAFIF